MEYRRIKGTRDILPAEYIERKVIYNIAENLFREHGYLPILTPTFEQTELFVRGIGEASDIVQKEMYTFLDRSNRSLTLRPEGTAPVVRAFIENNLKEFRYPLKLYYIMPMYRYERPQKGRLREFWQIGVEAFGVTAPEIDAEVIFLMVEYFQKLGLSEFTTEINTIGCRNCRKNYLNDLKAFLLRVQDNVCDDCKNRIQANPLRVFDCKNKECMKTLEDAPKITDAVCIECREHFELVKKFLNKLGVNYVINPYLVRGLDYYEKTTFEVKSYLLGAQSALGGGGRYDPLVEDCGGEPTPGLGFAIGVERLLLQLEQENKKPFVNLSADIYVVAYKGFFEKAFEIANTLRRKGYICEYDYLKRSMKAQFRNADKLGVKYCIIIAPEEDSANKVKIRDMKSGNEFLVSYDSLNKEVEKLLTKGERA